VASTTPCATSSAAQSGADPVRMYGNPLDVTCDEAAVKHLFMRLDCFAQCPAYDLLDMGADMRATEPEYLAARGKPERPAPLRVELPFDSCSRTLVFASWHTTLWPMWALGAFCWQFDPRVERSRKRGAPNFRQLGATIRCHLRSIGLSIFINLEDIMTEFSWNARYFDSVDGAAQCVRTTTIRADNADDADKIAKAQMGLCERVEVMRAATTGPSRVIYAFKEAVQRKQFNRLSTGATSL
jgi:hypothetical protein